MKYRAIAKVVGICIAFNAIAIDNSLRADPNLQASAMSGVINDDAPGWVWKWMTPVGDPDLRNGDGHAGGAASSGAFTFHGTNVEVFCLSSSSITVNGRVHRCGKAKLNIDGTEYSTTDLEGTTPHVVSLGKVTGLKDANHVVEIDAVDGWIVVDYLNVAADTILPDSAQIHPGSLRPDGTPSEGDYRLIPRNATDKCLEIVPGSVVNGAFLDISDPADSRSQIWHVYDLGGGAYRIGSFANPNKTICIPPDIPAGAAAGPRTVIWDYTGNPAQVFNILPTNSGYCKITLMNADRVLDVYQQKTDNGTPVLSWNFWGGPCQQWSFQPASRTTPIR